MTTIFGLVFVTLGFMVSLDWISEREAMMTEHVPTILAQEALEHHRAQVVESMRESISEGGVVRPKPGGPNYVPPPPHLRSFHMEDPAGNNFVYTFVVHPKEGESAVPIASEMHRLSGGHAGVGTVQAPDGITDRKRIIVSSRQTDSPIDLGSIGHNMAQAIRDDNRFRASAYLAPNIGAIVTKYDADACGPADPLRTLFPLDPDNPNPPPECGDAPDSDP